MGAVISLIPVDNDLNYNLPIKITYVLIYLFSFTILIFRKDLIKKAIKITLNNKLLILLSILIAISFTWSHNPAITIQRIFAFFGTLIFCIYFSLRYDKKEQISLLTYALSAILLVSILIALILPSYGISEENNGAWQGAFNQKNLLGKIMTLATITFLFYLSERKKLMAKILVVILILLSVCLTYLSQSKTAVLTTIMLAFIILCARILQKSKKSTKAFFMALIGIIVIISSIGIIYYGEDFLQEIGKDSTLTGRTELWSYSLDNIIKHPIIGHGYASFWIKDNDSPSEKAEYVLGWDPPHAHNGFIDLTLELGLIGLIIIIIQLIVISVKSSKLALKSKKFVNLWPLTLTAFLLIYNLTESSLIRSNSIFLVIYIYLLYNLNEYKSQ
ncbi:MAG: O-antigen ligase family protein [Nanoarchaeota archaeon]|nr:O-antigen ligase family protein [Nanoarchaeota archaeon]